MFCRYFRRDFYLAEKMEDNLAMVSKFMKNDFQWLTTLYDEDEKNLLLRFE